MKCPICQNTNIDHSEIQFDHEYSHHLSVAKGARIFCLCQNCLFGFYQEYFAEEDVKDIYMQKYRNHPIYSFDSGGDPFHKFAYNNLSLAQIVLAKHFYEFKKNDVMLDIGCGQGLSFWTAMNILPEMIYEAVEIGEQAQQYLEKLNVKVYNDMLFGVIDKLEINKYNFILMSHSLEHFNSYDLNRLVQVLYQIIKPESPLLVEVPFMEVSQQHNDKFGRNFIPDPTHLSFFSPNSLDMLFAQNQFNVRFISTVGPYYSKEIINTHQNTPRRLKKYWLKKTIMRVSPRKLKSILHTVKALKENKDVFSVLADETFSYGGDRTAIRLVATK